MRKLIFLLALSSFPFSCSRKPESLTYRDPKYPISIKYLKKNMQVEPFLNEEEQRYRIKVEADLSEEFPKELDPGMNSSLYNVIVCKDEEGFKDEKKLPKETTFNGIPALFYEDEEGKPSVYLLLIPGFYVEISLMGVGSRSYNPDEISQEYSDRREQLTHEMVKHFRWEQKIDTNSEEFGKWKQHIWEILKSGEKK